MFFSFLCMQAMYYFRQLKVKKVLMRQVKGIPCSCPNYNRPLGFLKVLRKLIQIFQDLALPFRPNEAWGFQWL
jgi:hypothetical protein